MWEASAQRFSNLLQVFVARLGLDSHVLLLQAGFTPLLLQHHKVKTIQPQAGHPFPLHLFQAGTFQRMQSYQSPIKSKLKHAKQMVWSVEALTADGTKILN